MGRERKEKDGGWEEGNDRGRGGKIKSWEERGKERKGGCTGNKLKGVGNLEDIGEGMRIRGR